MALYVADTIPAPWREWIPWIKNTTGWSLNTFFDSKLSIFWYVLRSDNTVERQYEDEFLDVHRLGRGSYLQIKSCYIRSNKSQLTSIINTHPAWPNALAISMVLYLFIYLYRHRLRRV